jgi:uncharacterized protein
MMRMKKGTWRQAALTVFVMSGLLAATASGWAAVSDGTDVPLVKTAPAPRSVDEEIKLANDYFSGHGVAQDLKLSAYWFKKAAEAGDPQAEMQIGYFYDAGIGVAKDPKLAAHWYQLAAAGGFATAKVDLGVLYLWGTGVEKNPQLAMQLFREAAEKGSGLANCYLGDVYFLGVGVPQDKAQGEQWYAKAAALHNPQAEYDLGMMFFNQKDHAHDAHKAAELFRESAGAGFVPAMASLGLLLVRNPPLAQSPEEAIDLLNRSAEAGLWKSSMILGVLARDGTGMPADPSAAYVHFRVAVLQGGDEAGKAMANDLKALTARLGPAQTQALDARAEEWQREHHLVLAFVYKEGSDRPRFPNYTLAAPENGSHTMQMISPTDEQQRQVF